MGTIGGIEVGEILTDLETRLDEYFGALNQIRLGLHVEIPPKPYEYILYEQCNELKLPLVEGALIDQPHIWLLQYGTCMQRDRLWRSIIENATRPREST